MTKTVAEALYNLQMFQKILQQKGEKAAVEFAESVLDPDTESESPKESHLKLVE